MERFEPQPYELWAVYELDGAWTYGLVLGWILPFLKAYVTTKGVARPVDVQGQKVCFAPNRETARVWADSAAFEAAKAATERDRARAATKVAGS